jgi:hypothetical protein
MAPETLFSMSQKTWASEPQGAVHGGRTVPVLLENAHPFTSIACLNPSLTKLKQMEVTKMHTPGNTAIQGCT